MLPVPTRRHPRLIRWTVLTVAVLGFAPLVLALLGALLVPLLLDTEAFKNKLDDWLEARTGCNVEIEGGLRVRFFPRLGVTLEKVRISNPAQHEFGVKDMLTCDRMHAAVEILPLLDKRVVFRRVEFEALDLRFVRAADGSGNWERFLDRFTPKKDEKHEYRSGGTAFATEMRHVECRDARIAFIDQAQQTSLAFAVQNFKFSMDDEARFKLGLDVGHEGDPTVRLDLVGAALAESNATRLHVVNASVQGRLPRLGETAPSFQATAKFDMLMPAGEVKNLRLEADSAGMHLQLAADAKSLLSSPIWSGTLQLTAPDLKAVCARLQLPSPRFAHTTESNRLALDSRFRLDTEGLILDDAVLVLASSTLRGSFVYLEEMDEQALRQPKMRVAATADYIDFAALLPQPPSVEKALQSIDAATSETIKPARFELRFELPKPELAFLQRLDAEFRLRSEFAKIGQAIAEDVDIDIVAQNGVIHSPRFAASFARGGFNAKLTAKPLEESLELDLALSVTGLLEGVPDGVASFKSPFSTIAAGTLHARLAENALSLTCDIPRFNLRDLLWTLGVGPGPDLDLKALKQVALAARLDASNGQARLQLAPFMVDQTAFKADLVYSDASRQVKTSGPRLEGSLTADMLDLDHILAHVLKNRFESAEPTQQGVEPKLDITIPAGLKARLKTDVTLLRWKGQSFDNVTATVALEQGQLQLAPLAFSVQSGKAELDLRLGAKDKVLDIGLAGKVENLPLGPFLVLSGNADNLRARLTGAFDAQARGKTREELFRNLAGTADLHAKTFETTQQPGQNDRLLRFDNLRAVLKLKHEPWAEFKQWGKDYVAGFEFGLKLAADKAALGQSVATNLTADSSGRVLLGHVAQRTRFEAVDLACSGRLPGLPGPDKNVSFAAQGRAAHGEATLDSFTLKAASTVTKGAAAYDSDSRNWRLRGQAAASSADLRQFFVALGLDLPAPRDSGAYKGSLAADFVAGRNSLKLEKAALDIAAGTLRGDLDIVDYSGPRLALDIASGLLDLDRLSTATASSKSGEWKTEHFAVGWLRTLSLRGRARLERCKVQGLDLENLELALTAGKGVLQTNTIAAGLAGGRIKGSLGLSATGQGLSMQLGLDLSKVDLGQLDQAKALSGLLDRVAPRGLLTAAAKLETQASGSSPTLSALLSAVQGKGELHLRQGAFGIPAAAAKAASNSASQAPRVLEYTTCDATFSMDKGALSNTDLAMNAAMYALTGEGRVDFGRETIDYTLQVQAAAVASWPIRISGSLSQPTVDVNSLAAVGDTLGRTLALPFRPLTFMKDAIFGR